MQNFKDLKVWEKAHAFTLSVYKATEQFPKKEMFGIVSQLRRSASSVAANVAEGCGRKTNRDFARFLNIALGSANESEYFLILAKDLVYLTENDFKTLSLLVNEIKAMLIRLIGKVQEN
ncbi:MAG: four helix bundle protein [Bacteroidetes bacterium]|nr:four helix bundle protein [Bacteroidota bacterium]